MMKIAAGAARAERLDRAARALDALRRAALDAEAEFAAEILAAHPAMHESARNLVHYLAVRRHDLRELQEELARLGLSSLGRMEAHVMASLEAVIAALHALRHDEAELPAAAAGITFESGPAILARNAAAMLGPAPAGMEARVMVTAPREASSDARLVHELVQGGMQILRINCAHDSPLEWERMVRNLRRAERETGKRCHIEFDLAGPKLRTGPIAAGPPVVKWRPRRDAFGRVVQRARVRLASGRRDPLSPDVYLPVSAAFLAPARVGDRVELIDARDRKRVLEVVHHSPGECVCETDTTAYVVPDTALVMRRDGHVVAEGGVGELAGIDLAIELRSGDTLHVVRGDWPGVGAARAEDGHPAMPPMVSCALAELFRGVRAGEPILFDDGKVRGVIREVLDDHLIVSITQVVGGAAKLRSEKGINVPESDLGLPALTAKDMADLDFIAKHGDMVAISFVQRPEDIKDLIEALRARHASRLGIVLKIETRAAFERLPMLLLAAMRDPPVAVMAARGDLGVEVGFERLSEVQEEILWLCEAAHVPVIWATQVLESLAKGGMPSRAEVTDAAMGSRAECVMLNKGPYIREALRFLVDVLHRMDEHQHKKSARLRKLRVSEPKRPRPKARSAA